MFKLHTIQETISHTLMKCDGVSLLFDTLQRLPNNKKYGILHFIVYNKQLSIQPNNPYLHIEVVDTETGDLLEYNCLKHVHQYNISKRIYPDYLLNIFK